MIYLLFYGTDTGASEDWTVFYTPAEAFRTEEERTARIEFLSKIELSGGMKYDFDTRELDFTDRVDAPHAYGYDDEQ